MNAGLCIMHVFLFSALSPLGLSVSHRLGSGEDVMWHLCEKGVSKNMCVLQSAYSSLGNQVLLTINYN